MREFKFRFWDKVQKKMYYRKPLTYDFEHPNIMPMQFTGLKDKNGKEIYEGDICQIMMRRRYGHQSDGNAIVGAVEFGRVVVNDNTLYVYEAFHIEGVSIQYLIGNELEVVGNVYENPELLIDK